MIKRNASFLAVFMIISMAAAATAGVVSLEADVPAGQTLKGYRFTVTSDTVKIVKAESKSGFEINAANSDASVAVANGADTKGIAGPATVQIMDITVEGSVKDKDFNIITDSFGTSGDVQFSPDGVRIKVK
jgi:hypothetical protein